MRIKKSWAMPSGDTFSIKPIKELFERYRIMGGVIVDPFAKDSKLGTIRNDLNPNCDTEYHMDALEFLKMLPSDSADMVIFDPPYSIKQCVELYKGYGKKKLETAITNIKYWSLCKENVARILKNGGISIFCGWNTNAIGKCNGAIQEEILLVSHGGMHNDTLVTVERIKK
jgi:hypothetical protein